MIDLEQRRPVPAGTLRAMAAALAHRGPDEDGFLQQPGLGLASRRLSIVGLADGRQPIANEDRSVVVVFNGEVFEYPERRAELERRGHCFTTHCDTEVVPHLWEDHEEGLFERLRGQFALALWDQRRQRLVLGRDRFGICPLYWTRQRTPTGEWLLFASEIKALLASGLVAARADLRGLDQAFTFLGLPGPRTCFQGVHALVPGHYLRVQLGRPGQAARLSDHTYWEMDFPDRGMEEPGRAPADLVAELEARLLRAVEHRLRADVPVVAYLSGGVDSSLIVAMANRLRGRPLPTFTIQVRAPGLDETAQAAAAARHVGGAPVIVSCGAPEILGAYPRLIQAAEFPVSDTCCAALLLLAREVHARGYKVALTGEGADEALAGYPWYKVHRLLSFLDFLPGLPLSRWARCAFLRQAGGSRFRCAQLHRAQQALGGHPAWLDLYSLLSLSRLPFYGPQMRDALGDYLPYDDLGLSRDRVRSWHPLNQSLYLGIRVHLAGLLLGPGGDRVAMHSAVETRYPFLDEEVMSFLARLHPRWKLRGFRDKYLLRRLAERWLPRTIAWRPKQMFRAPFGLFCGGRAPPFVEQLLSPESLRTAGYFDPEAVRQGRRACAVLRPWAPRRFPLELGLAGVAATQLWHHMFLDGTLADLPSHAGPRAGEPEAGERAIVVGSA
jgi:asparagine synthase (glutamine-hydrolysing)